MNGTNGLTIRIDRKWKNEVFRDKIKFDVNETFHLM